MSSTTAPTERDVAEALLRGLQPLSTAAREKILRIYLLTAPDPVAVEVRRARERERKRVQRAPDPEAEKAANVPPAENLPTGQTAANVPPASSVPTGQTPPIVPPAENLPTGQTPPPPPSPSPAPPTPPAPAPVGGVRVGVHEAGGVDEQEDADAPRFKDGSRKDRPESLEVLTERTRKFGLPDTDAEWLWNKWLGNGFRNNKEKMKDWRAVVRQYQLNNILPSTKIRGRPGPAPHGKPADSRRYDEEKF